MDSLSYRYPRFGGRLGELPLLLSPRERRIPRRDIIDLDNTYETSHVFVSRGASTKSPRVLLALTVQAARSERASERVCESRESRTRSGNKKPGVDFSGFTISMTGGRDS